MVGHTKVTIEHSQTETNLRQWKLDNVAGNWPKCDLRYCDLRYHPFFNLARGIKCHTTLYNHHLFYWNSLIKSWYISCMAQGAVCKRYRIPKNNFFSKEYIMKIQFLITLTRSIIKGRYYTFLMSRHRSIKKAKYIG